MALFHFVRNILFNLEAERAHHFTMKAFRIGNKLPFFSSIFSGRLKDESPLGYDVAGLHFPNRVGMAAGFDKNALYLKELKAMGFGFVEIGTVTPKPQTGNPKPRLFRLPEDHALINRMGFNNDGADVIAERLKKRPKDLIVGGNIGKNKLSPNEEAVKDYAYCFEKLYPVVDYFVVNVSSPNTPGLRELQDKAALSIILQEVQRLNTSKPALKPVFLKIAPDLTNTQLDEIVEIVSQTGITGIIATNTTISRAGLLATERELEEIGPGGLSGLPLKDRAYQVLHYLKTHCQPGTILMSSGGIMDPSEARRRIDAGAHLVQLYTGFIYEGPGLVKGIKTLISGLR
jgi:dihydroorotate dehydrogenase